MNRTPIKINEHCIALIKLYKRHDYLEDIWTSEFDMIINQLDDFKIAAKQFVKQLENEWCISFMEALRDEINKNMKEHINWCKKNQDMPLTNNMK